MANIVGDIAIQVGADIGPLVTQLGKASGAVSKFGKDAQASGGGMALASKAGIALGGAVVAAGAAMVSFTRAAMDNIDALSKQARVAGVSVATFQAMSLVAEEAGVSSEALSKSLVKMQDNITSLGKGGASQIAVFDQLGISFSEVGKLSADAQFELIAERISAISDPTTRTSAALDVFGKSGADALNMMTGYSAALANATDFQNQFGLAVSDLDAANIEAANDAMGRVGIAVGSLGTQFAIVLAPAIEASANAIVSWMTSLVGAQAELDSLLGSAERAKVILGEDVVNAILKSGQVSEESAVSIEKLRGAYDGLGRDVTVAIRSIGDQIPVLLENGLDQMALDLSDVSGEMEIVQGAFDRGTISVDEYEKRMSDATAEAIRLLTEAGKIDGVNMSGAIGQVGALARALSIAGDFAARIRALLPGGSASVSAAPSFETGGRGGNPSAVVVRTPDSGTVRPKPAPNGIGGIDWGAPYDNGGGGGGGGGSGGGGSNSADELQRLQDQFATESEVIAAQYAERLAQLEEFRQQKLLSEEAYNALEGKIKDDHEKNLADIENKRRSERLSAISGAFGDLATLTQSGNEKLFKIGQAAKVAEAIVEGYSAAVAAWNKGMKVGGPGMAAAFTAASLAKTGMLIASMKSQSSSGGGGRGTSGGGGATAPTQTTTETRTANINFYGGFQPTQETISMIAGGLNDWLGDGGRLNVGAA